MLGKFWCMSGPICAADQDSFFEIILFLGAGALGTEPGK